MVFDVYLKLLKEYYDLKKIFTTTHTSYISKECYMNYYFLPEGNVNIQSCPLCNHLTVKLSAHLLPLGIFTK